MQTFLPFPNFIQSAQSLHYRHLGKQRVEIKQIFIALTQNKGWIHHPATKMWTGYEFQLLEYGKVICTEWINRGYNDSLLPFFKQNQECLFIKTLPPWFGNEFFHESHRSNLMNKKPEYYNFPNTRLKLSYQWPVLTDGGYFLKKGNPVI